MIFDNLQTIFIHIPKAGGTSIENLMWPDVSTRKEKDLWMGLIDLMHNKYQTGGLQHLLAKQVKQEVGSKKFDDYYKFTVVRNPWDKLVSQFIYMRKRPDLRNYISMQENATFKEYLTLIQTKEHVQWKPQFEFITDDSGAIIVDDIFKLEEIKNHYNQLSLKSGVDFSNLGHENKGQREHYSRYYDNESIDLVAKLYSKDIELFDYTFKKE